MKKIVFDYICMCESFKTAIKSLHWDSKNMSQHKLCDDIADRISDFQDQISEVEQSISGNLPLNKLKAKEYKVVGLKSFVEDVIEETKKFYKKVKKLDDNYVGMASDCESFISDMQRNLYLVNFTLKEEFKREYRKKINEQKGGLTISCGKIREIVNECVKKCMNESVNDNNYTHFAVNKYTNLIVDGWDYSGYDSDELRQFKRDYFFDDLRDNGYNPKVYKILTLKGCNKAGLDVNNQSTCWSNTGLFPLFHEKEMMKQGEKPWDIAYEKHPDWFVD